VARHATSRDVPDWESSTSYSASDRAGGRYQTAHGFRDPRDHVHRDNPDATSLDLFLNDDFHGMENGPFPAHRRGTHHSGIVGRETENETFVFVGGIWEQVRVDGRAPLEKILDNVRVVGVVDCLGVLDIGFFGVEVARRMVAL